MKTDNMKITIRGITNLIMHNGRLADDSDLLTVARREAQQAYKKNTTAENWERFAMAMMRGGIYFDDAIGVYLPEDNLRTMIVKAGAGVKKKAMQTYKSAASTISFDCDGSGFPMLIDGKTHMNLDAFCATKRYRFEKVVTIGKAKVRSVRPLIPKGWETTISIDYRPDVIEKDMIRELFENAGLEIGIGDWRPSAPKPGPFGQFIVTHIDGGEV